MIKTGPGILPGVHPLGRHRPGRSTTRRINGKLCSGLSESLASLLCVKRVVVEAFSG